MSDDRAYTWQELMEGVLVIGFVSRRAEGQSADATYDRDVAEFENRIQELDSLAPMSFAVIDFENYEPTWENGRAVVSLVLAAQRKLAAKGGRVLVCNHPAQFNPDLQQMFRMDKVIDIRRSRQEALEAVRSSIQERDRQTGK